MRRAFSTAASAPVARRRRRWRAIRHSLSSWASSDQHGGCLRIAAKSTAGLGSGGGCIVAC